MELSGGGSGQKTYKIRGDHGQTYLIWSDSSDFTLDEGVFRLLGQKVT